MIKKVIFIISIMCVFCCCGRSYNEENNHQTTKTNNFYSEYSEDEVIMQDNEYYDDENDDEDEEVFVCRGDYAYAYHNDELCDGIQACKGIIEEITLSEAEDEGRIPCRYCIYGVPFPDDDDDDFLF